MNERAVSAVVTAWACAPRDATSRHVWQPRQVKALLAPFPLEALTCWPVSARVGNVKNNTRA